MLGAFVYNIELFFKIARDDVLEIFYERSLVDTLFIFKLEKHVPSEGIGYTLCFFIFFWVKIDAQKKMNRCGKMFFDISSE